MNPQTAWVLGIFSMLIVLLYAWHRTGDLLLALLVLNRTYWCKATGLYHS